MAEFAAEAPVLSPISSDPVAPELYCTFALTGDQLRHQAIYVCKSCTASGRSKKGECCCEGCARSCHGGHKLEFVCFGAAYCDCGKAGESKCKLIGASRVEAEKILPSRKAAPSSSSASSAAADTHPPFCRVHLIDYPSGRDEILREQCIELVRHSKDTFWLGRGDEPRCLLEQLAREILDYHCQGLPEAAGAEWWVQVKDASQGIDLHYDKDEKIAEVFQLGYFPSLSTVTYLTQGSSEESPCQVPTVVFNTTAKAPIGDSPIREVAVSFPQVGKHISFQGDLLHGAPVQWLKGDQEDQEKEENPSKTSQKVASEGAGQQKRVTFLLNVWSDHRPADVRPLPDEVLAALTLVSPGAPLPGCVLSALEPPAEMSVSLADAKGETDRAGDFVTIPFISEQSAWGKDEDEQGLVCVVWVPESTQAGRVPSEPSTVLIKYLHDDCAASLMYEDDDEEWEDEDEDEEEGEEGDEGDEGEER